MKRNATKPPGVFALTLLVAMSIAAGIGLGVADYAADVASSIRERFRAITKV